MARYWLHNGFLQVEGEKMSKSLGNFVTIRELLDNDWQVFGTDRTAFNMLRTHYRQPIDWTGERAEQDRRLVNGTSWRRCRARRAHAAASVDAMSDDLNPPKVSPRSTICARSAQGLRIAKTEGERPAPRPFDGWRAAMNSTEQGGRYWARVKLDL